MQAIGLHEICVELPRQLEPYALIRKDGPDPEHAREAGEIYEILLSLARHITLFQGLTAWTPAPRTLLQTGSC